MTDLYTATARLIVKLRLGEITEAIEKVALREDERARSRHIRTIVRAQLMRLCGVVCYVRGLSLFLHNKHQQWTDVLTHSQRHPSLHLYLHLHLSPSPSPSPMCAAAPAHLARQPKTPSVLLAALTHTHTATSASSSSSTSPSTKTPPSSLLDVTRRPSRWSFVRLSSPTI
jgi:hypothetical protein